MAAKSSETTATDATTATVAPAADPADSTSQPSITLDATPARALGEFIRAHRERLSPLAVGLPPGPRRRTPGLRREEVAQLCGVSPTWYTWIEQGRPVSASADALARIADALQLSRAERAYLFEVAAQRDPAGPNANAADAPATLLATVALVDAPAYVLDRQWNALAWNAPAAALFTGWLDDTGPQANPPADPLANPPANLPTSPLAGPQADPLTNPPANPLLPKNPQPAHAHNLLRFTFTTPAARALIVDWDTRAQRLVAEFRADAIRHLNDAPTRALIDALCAASDDFARFWASQDVGEREGGRREFNHPRAGRLAYDQITLKPAHREDLKLVVLVRAQK